MKYLFVVFTFSLLFSACQDSPEGKVASDGIREVIRSDGDYSEVIKIEDSILDENQDTTHVAKMTFDELEYDFGTVNEGDIVRHAFSYTNTGNKPLMLKVAYSTCGCTVPTYNTDVPLQPGQKDSIVVSFNTTHKPNHQEKPITVVANSYPNKVILYLRGYVNQKN